MDKDDICMSDDISEAMTELRRFMFTNVYTNPVAKSEEIKASKMLKEMYYYFNEHFEEIPETFRKISLERNESRERIVCDYIAGMSDQYAISIFKKIFIPVSWSK